MLATSAVTSPDALSLFVPLFQSLGIPGAIMLILAYSCKKFIQWAIPHLEKVIASWVSRQLTMEECQRKLTESTIEIQQKNSTLLASVEASLPRVCQGFREFSHKADNQDQHENQKTN